MHSYKNSDVPPPIMQGSPPPLDMRVPPIDWDRPPWNRWAFQHMSQILRTAPIRRGHNPTTLSESLQDISALTYQRVDGGSSSIIKMLDDTYTDGMLVMHRGEVIHESYHNGMHRRSLHIGQSVSKSIVATAAAILFENGTIDVHAPVTEYLPELADTAWNGATVQHVIDMTTGVRYSESYEQRDSDVGKTDVASGWKPPPEDMDTSLVVAGAGGRTWQPFFIPLNRNRSARLCNGTGHRQTSAANCF